MNESSQWINWPIMTALWGTGRERHIETSFSFHPSLPLLQCLILVPHLGGVTIACLLHSYNLTPSATCPQWLLALHRLWLKSLCLGKTTIYTMTAHRRQTYNGMRAVDCMGPLVRNALIASMAKNIDTPCSLSYVSGLEGLILTLPRSSSKSSKVKF